jgi:hypothetical protein
LPVVSKKCVIARWTGNPTSTFGGGGGTKAFCSQALRVVSARMAKRLRQIAGAFCVVLCGLPGVVEHADFIPMPHSSGFRKLILLEGRVFRDPLNSNNPLAVELETENPVRRDNFPSELSAISNCFQRQQEGFIQMFNALRGKAALWTSISAVVLVVVPPAFAQTPTDAQRAAIRSECRSDYEAHCASVPPGGMASLQCLQKNMSSLSSGCQSAVRAVEATAEPKAESKPEPKAEAEPKTESAPAASTKPAAAAPAATPAPKAAAAAPANKPSSAQIAAIRSACRSDYQKNCAGVPTGGAPALQCLDKNKAKLSASCQTAVTAASGGAATPAAGGAPAAAATAAPAAAPATVLVLRPMRPREELFVLRSACGGDVRALCGGVTPGGGRIIQCLATQAASLSPACKDVLGQFAAQ